MFYFCIFYIIPCLVSEWIVNKLYSTGYMEYQAATIFMLFAFFPFMNILTLIFLIYLFKNRNN